jgi:hypothetical protein
MAYPGPFIRAAQRSASAMLLSGRSGRSRCGIDRERWSSWVREADALLVNGGDPLYLCHWMRESGLADRPNRPDRRLP